MSGAASIEALLHDPAAWADPERVAARIAPGLATQTARGLFTSPRTASRAAARLADELGGGDAAALSPIDRAMLLASPRQLQNWGDCAGAVWNARRVRALMRGSDIAALVARFGADARMAALRHPPPQYAKAAGELADSAAGDLAQNIAQNIAEDGARCVAAWRAELPAWVQARLDLVSSASAAAMEDAPRRAALLRTLAAEMPCPSPILEAKR